MIFRFYKTEDRNTRAARNELTNGWFIDFVTKGSCFSLPNSCQHSANADVFADMKSKIIVSCWYFFADMVFSATSKVQNYQNKTGEKSLNSNKYCLLHISRNFKDTFRYICFSLNLYQTVNNWQSAIVFIDRRCLPCFFFSKY